MQRKEFILVNLKDHPRVTSCGGCPYPFPRVNKQTYPPPDDIVIAHKEQSVWRDRATGVLRKSNKAANRYYHPNIQCVRKGNNGGNNSFSFKDLDITTIELLDEHKALIQRNFGHTF